jgi:hypothetical protein
VRSVSYVRLVLVFLASSSTTPTQYNMLTSFTTIIVASSSS